jgi:hypothetical protein
MQAIVITNKNKYKVNQLSAQQLAALSRFACRHGRQWKSKLNQSWMDGCYGNPEDAGWLQQVRNQFGPSWLVKFNLKKALGQ